jgi:hypothetical protein
MKASYWIAGLGTRHTSVILLAPPNRTSCFPEKLFCHSLDRKLKRQHILSGRGDEGDFYTVTLATNFMEPSICSEADSSLVSQENFRFLWDAKVHYRDHKSSPFDSVLNQINPVHTLFL